MRRGTCKGPASLNKLDTCSMSCSAVMQCRWVTCVDCLLDQICTRLKGSLQPPGSQGSDKSISTAAMHACCCVLLSALPQRIRTSTGTSAAFSVQPPLSRRCQGLHSCLVGTCQCCCNAAPLVLRCCLSVSALDGRAVPGRRAQSADGRAPAHHPRAGECCLPGTCCH